MKQKTTLKFYLILGISIISIFISAQSCSTTEYRADAEYVYTNDTDSIIEVKGLYPFVIKPQEEHVIKQVVDGSSENMIPTDYVSPFGDYAIIISNNKCKTLQPGDEM